MSTSSCLLISLQGLSKLGDFLGSMDISGTAAADDALFMVDAGILDPAKVTRSALQNATSVASTLLNFDI